MFKNNTYITLPGFYQHNDQSCNQDRNLNLNSSQKHICNTLMSATVNLSILFIHT